MMKSFVGGTNPYILTGFDIINPGSAIGTQNVSIRVADSVVYYPGSAAGPFFHGLEEGNSQATPLVPELRKNSTNYVYLTLTTTEAAKDTRAFWDPDKEGGVGGEFTQDVNTQAVLTAAINVSVSAFPENTVPVCKVVVGPNFITSIEDARDMMFRLGAGGLNPDPLSTYSFRNEPASAYARNEPNTLMSSALDPNSFQGGDKNIQTLKEWMDVVMTKLLELGGTTYWYEDASSFNIVNTFKDALSTSMRSKGTWESSSVTQGQLTWSEDIQLQQVADDRNIIVRAGSETLANNQALYIKQVRDASINTGSVSVDWTNGLNYVNGTLGSFENLTKGDWIKKSNAEDNEYVRVEEFYVAANLGGGVTTSALALSIKLSSVFPGTSETQQGVYTQGVYQSSDVLVNDRNNVDLITAGGDLYWLAMRSDTVMTLSDVTSSTVTGDISDHDGTVALVTSAAHGLVDGQQITFAGTTNFDGTYTIQVNDVNTFTIQVTGGTFANEAAQNAYFATVTTTTTSTADGLQLESAAHGFETGQRIFITNTTNFNASYDIFVTGSSTFTIPVGSAIANETSGNATLTAIMVRTDIGPSRLVPGSIKVIGEADTQNIQSFIGMDALSQTSPVWNISPSYNTINGQVNYNSNDTDNLTDRASKLTAMMADKTQDKTIVFSPIYDYLENTTNASNQDITFTHDSASPILNILMNSSSNNGTVALGGTLSLAVNQAAYLQVDRNTSFSIADLTGLTVANIADVPLEENVFIFAIRETGTSVWIWNGTEMVVGKNLTLGVVSEILNENAYDEKLTVVAGAPADSNEVTGPIIPGVAITLPNDSRDGGNSQGYVVGQGVLEVYLNGQELISGDDWSELGSLGSVATTFQIDIDLEVDDILLVRIDTAGGYFGVGGGGGSGEANTASSVGSGDSVYHSKSGVDLRFKSLIAGTDMEITSAANDLTLNAKSGFTNIVTKVATDTLVLTEDVILVDASGGSVTLNLPAAATAGRKIYNVKKIDGTGNSVIIDADSTETIDGALTLSTVTQYESFTIVCDGTAWYII